MDADPKQRLLMLEGKVAFLEDFSSRLLGEQHALKAATLGFITLAGRVPEARDSIITHLEKTYASMLGGSTNQPGLDAFEETAELIRLALDDWMERERSNADNPPQ